MTLPPPGWYPDPEQPARKRWWSGDTWTARTDDQPAPAPAPAPEPAGYVPMPFHPAAPEERVVPRPVGTKSSRAKQANFPSWVGLVIGAISILYNPFALASLPAVLVSIFGLAIAISLKRSTGTFTGGFFALGGIALALVTFGFAWPEIAFFLDLQQTGIPDIPGIDEIVPTVTPFPEGN